MLGMVWLCLKRCGYVGTNCNHTYSKNGVAGVAMLRVVWLCLKRCGYVWTNCNHTYSKNGVAVVADVAIS